MAAGISPTLGVRVPKSWRRRLLLGAWILCGQVLLMGYSGNLISYMTEPGLEEAIDTLAKLASEVDRGRFACGTIWDAAEHNLLRSDNSSVSRLLLRAMESSKSNFVRSDVEGLRECLRRDYAYIAAQITVDADIDEPEWFLFAQDSFRMESYVLVFPKDFACIEPFNRKISQLQAGGLVTKWLHHTLLRARKRSHHEEPRVHPLAVTNLEGPFLLLSGGLAAATLAAILELMAATRRNKYSECGMHSGTQITAQT